MTSKIDKEKQIEQPSHQSRLVVKKRSTKNAFDGDIL